MQQEANMNRMGQFPADMMQGMAEGIQQQQNLPPETIPNNLQGGFRPIIPTQFRPNRERPPHNQQTPMNDIPNPGQAVSPAAHYPVRTMFRHWLPVEQKVAHNPPTHLLMPW